MKFTIKFSDQFYIFHLKYPFDKNIAWLKQIALKRINNLSSFDEQLVLKKGKLSYPDDWNLSAIPYGAIVHCYLECSLKPNDICLRVRLVFADESYYFTDIDWNSTIIQLKATLQENIGVPVGVFRLLYQDMELYDCQTIESYDIPRGATLLCQTWNCWNDFLYLVKSGTGVALNIESKMLSDSKIKAYQAQAGLLMAAYMGHAEIAEKMINCGAKIDKPLGPHPIKRWCYQKKDHPAYYNSTPIHQAATYGHMSLVLLFIKVNPQSIYCHDIQGKTPLDVAISKQQKLCCQFLEKEHIKQKTEALKRTYTKIPFKSNNSNYNSLRDVTTKHTLRTDTKLSLNYKYSYSLEHKFATQKVRASLVHVDGFHESLQTCKENKSSLLPFIKTPHSYPKVRFNNLPSTSSEYTRQSAAYAKSNNLMKLSFTSTPNPDKFRLSKSLNDNEFMNYVQKTRGQSKREKAQACFSHVKMASNDPYLTQINLASKLSTRNPLEKIIYSEKAKVTII